MDRYQFSQEVRSFVERSPAPMAVYQFLNKRVVTLLLSQGFCALFGYEDRRTAYYDMDTDMYKETHPDDVARIADAALRFATQDVPYEVIYRTRIRNSADYRIIHAIGTHVFTGEGVRLAYVWYTDEGRYDAGHSRGGVSLSDSLTSALHQQSLLTASNYDYLTGLPSMTYFFELAEAGREELLREGQTPALLFIDLNGMKYYNTTYGFAQGDELLRAFSKLLISHFSNENCSRLGQDHFAVFTALAGLEQSLQDIFEKAHTLNGARALPVRVGVYVDQGDGVDVATACDRAKFACDVDRHAYLSRYTFFDAGMRAAMGKRQYILDNLDRALREGWIVPYYQPIVRTASALVCDEEALARWIDPVEHKFLTPGDFVPVLEDAKLIYKVDLYMVDQVLANLKRRQEAGQQVCPVSLNLSRTDFDVCDIVEEIHQRVQAAQISPALLNVEITESVVGSDFAFIQTQVQRFHELGFQVWMDDFGSGYSSLDVLQSVDFDLIKLDMRFMQQFDNSERCRVILTELMKLALHLGIETVCEGVERAEQLAFLHEIGCTKVQGYYFSHPLPLEEMDELCRSGGQIRLEQPAEQPYYAAIGAINLYAPSVITNSSALPFRHLFNTIPMAILELNHGRVSVLRCNQFYRAFLKRVIGLELPEQSVLGIRPDANPSDTFFRFLKTCRPDGKWHQSPMDESLPQQVVSFLREIAANPVNGARAFELVVLAMMDQPQEQSFQRSPLE